MPNVQKTNIIAILCSDIHLSHKMPRCRQDDDWYGSMGKILDQLVELKEKFECPVLCAGDVFDRWNSPPELINFALDRMPNMIAIPGQHDLPLHRYDLIKQSAYWTLVAAGKIKSLEPDHTTGQTEIQGFGNRTFQVTGFPWGFDPNPKKSIYPDLLNIAMVHKYIYADSITKYTHANSDDHFSKLTESLAGYDVAVFGDNHKMFLKTAGDCTVFNPGSLMRRTIADTARRWVGLLLADGCVQLHEIVEDGKFVEAKEDAPDAGMIESFIQKLEDEGDDHLDFETYVKSGLNVLDARIRKVVVKIMNEVSNGEEIRADS